MSYSAEILTQNKQIYDKFIAANKEVSPKILGIMDFYAAQLLKNTIYVSYDQFNGEMRAAFDPQTAQQLIDFVNKISTNYTITNRRKMDEIITQNVIMNGKKDMNSLTDVLLSSGAIEKTKSTSDYMALLKKESQSMQNYAQEVARVSKMKYITAEMPAETKNKIEVVIWQTIYDITGQFKSEKPELQTDFFPEMGKRINVALNQNINYDDKLPYEHIDFISLLGGLPDAQKAFYVMVYNRIKTKFGQTTPDNLMYEAVYNISDAYRIKTPSIIDYYNRYREILRRELVKDPTNGNNVLAEGEEVNNLPDGPTDGNPTTREAKYSAEEYQLPLIARIPDWAKWASFGVPFVVLLYHFFKKDWIGPYIRTNQVTYALKNVSEYIGDANAVILAQQINNLDVNAFDSGNFAGIRQPEYKQFVPLPKQPSATTNINIKSDANTENKTIPAPKQEQKPAELDENTKKVLNQYIEYVNKLDAKIKELEKQPQTPEIKETIADLKKKKETLTERISNITKYIPGAIGQGLGLAGNTALVAGRVGAIGLGLAGNTALAAGKVAGNVIKDAKIPDAIDVAGRDIQAVGNAAGTFIADEVKDKAAKIDKLTDVIEKKGNKAIDAAADIAEEIKKGANSEPSVKQVIKNGLNDIANDYDVVTQAIEDKGNEIIDGPLTKGLRTGIDIASAIGDIDAHTDNIQSGVETALGMNRKQKIKPGIEEIEEEMPIPNPLQPEDVNLDITQPSLSPSKMKQKQPQTDEIEDDEEQAVNTYINDFINGNRETVTLSGGDGNKYMLWREEGTGDILIISMENPNRKHEVLFTGAEVKKLDPHNAQTEILARIDNVYLPKFATQEASTGLLDNFAKQTQLLGKNEFDYNDYVNLLREAKALTDKRSEALKKQIQNAMEGAKDLYNDEEVDIGDIFKKGESSEQYKVDVSDVENIVSFLIEQTNNMNIKLANATKIPQVKEAVTNYAEEVLKHLKAIVDDPITQEDKKTVNNELIKGFEEGYTNLLSLIDENRDKFTPELFIKLKKSIAVGANNTVKLITNSISKK